MPNSEKFPTYLLNFQFKDVGIASLAHSKCRIKIIFGHTYFIGELIFKIFAALFTTFGLQKDDKVIFFLWCLRKEILKNAFSEIWCTDSS